MLWDLETVSPVGRFEHRGKATGIALADDQATLAVGIGDGKADAYVVAFDVATKKERWRVSVGPKQQVWGVSIRRDRVVTVATDGTIRHHDLKTGAVTSSFPHTFTRKAWVSSVAFSSDGSRVLVGSSADVQLWNVDDGAVLQRYVGEDEAVNSVAFADGERTVVAGSMGKRHHVWDAATGAATGVLRGHADCSAVASSPHGAVALGCAGGDVDVFSLKTGENRSNLPVWEGSVDSMRYTPDAERLVIFHGGVLRIFGAKSHKLLVEVRDSGYSPRAAAFSADGERLVAIADKSLYAWDFKSFRMLGHVTERLGIEGLSVSGDGRTVVAGVSDRGRRGTMLVWKPETGDVRRLFDELQGPGWVTSETSPSIVASALSTDGRLGVAALGTISRTPGVRGSLAVLDIVSGRVTGKVPLGGVPERVALDPTATKATVTLVDGSEEVIRIADGTKIGTSPPPGNRSADSNASVLAQSADGAYRVSPGPGGGLTIARSTGASIDVVVREGEWLAYTPDGYFDASKGGTSLASAVVGTRAYRANQVVLKLGRPDLLFERMGFGPPSLVSELQARRRIVLAKAGLDERTVDVSLVAPPEARFGASVAGNTATLEIEAKATQTQLATLHVLVNDVPVLGVDGKALPPKGGRLTERISLAGGVNRIEVSVRDVAGVESFRDVKTIESTAARTGALYFLGVGVSKYRNSDLDLEFAAADATALESVFRRMRPKFSRVETKTLLDADATKAAIEAASGFFAKAEPDDTIVLFVAGHGIYVDGKYVYVPHDADKKAIAKTAVPFDAFERAFARSAARNRLFLLDTCESGDREAAAPVGRLPGKVHVRAGARGLVLDGVAAPSTASPVPSSASTARDRDRFLYSDVTSRTGAVILSSSRGDERSYEDPDAGHGVFTAAILEAMDLGKGDLDHDGYVSAAELRHWVSIVVPERTDDLQHPNADREVLGGTLSLPRPTGAQERSAIGRMVDDALTPKSDPVTGFARTPAPALSVFDVVRAKALPANLAASTATVGGVRVGMRRGELPPGLVPTPMGELTIVPGVRAILVNDVVQQIVLDRSFLVGRQVSSLASVKAILGPATSDGRRTTWTVRKVMAIASETSGALERVVIGW